jgi:hypothetical protein
MIKRNTAFGEIMKENLYRKIYFPDGSTNYPMEFSPQEDITTYELTLLLSLLLNPRRSAKFFREKLSMMPENIKRHFN